MGASVMDLITYTNRFPQPGETVSGKHFSKGFGGKTSNACVMATKLGLNGALLAKVGDDVFGREMLENFDNCHINTENVLITKETFTATASICVSDSGENTIVYVPGPTNLLMPSEISERRSSLFKDCKLFVSTFECIPESLLVALSLARTEGVKTLVNAAPPFPSLPSERLYALCDIFCLNETEAAIMTEIQIKTIEDSRQSCRLLLDRGCGSVILTLGAKGALYMDRTQEVYVPCQDKVTPVDTTGAGDAFVGALAYYLVCHPCLSMQEQIKRSCYIATRSVLKKGTQSSYPDKHELPDYLFKD